jgi:hypothetical protein
MIRAQPSVSGRNRIITPARAKLPAQNAIRKARDTRGLFPIDNVPHFGTVSAYRVRYRIGVSYPAISG